MGTCGCPGSFNQQEIESFNIKNYYSVEGNADEEKIREILGRVAPAQDQLQYRKYAAFLSLQPRFQFVDQKFSKLDQGTNTQRCSLQRLYNFQRLRLQKVYQSNKISPLDTINQQEVELSYLSCVFYLICQSAELKQRIFVTSLINPHSAYIVKLFCNGQPENVVVDPTVPVTNGNIKYLTIRHPEEIWPFLLEKAWCKQIGAYDKARGLSPEDCFQQITGIPAYSYQFAQYPPATNSQKILEIIRCGFWVALTANDSVNSILPRQVFYLQGFNEKTKFFTIRSPYTNYFHPNKQRSDSLQVQFEQILSMFQFLTVGIYIPNYIPISLKFASVRDQQKIFEIDVKVSTRINIRLIQFYEQYLNASQQQHYRYSPVLMELYDHKYDIVPNFEGRLENLEGIRSSNLGDSILESIKPGLYYLRVQVQWQTQNRNEACVVVYTGKNIASIKQHPGDVIDFSAKLLSYTLEQPTSEIIDKKSQQIRVRHKGKTYGHILGIENLSKAKTRLKIIFKDSYNIRVNHHSLDNNILYTELEGLKERVLEILPADSRKQYYLAPFDIVKF